MSSPVEILQFLSQLANQPQMDTMRDEKSQLAQQKSQNETQDIQSLIGSRAAQNTQYPVLNALRKAQLGAIPSQNALRESQIGLNKARLSDPNMGQPLTGPGAQIESLDRIKKMFGADSQEYQMALDKFKSDMDLQKSRSQYLTSNVEYKNLTPLKKYEVQLAEANANGDSVGAREAQAAIDNITGSKPAMKQALSSKMMLDTLDSVDIPKIANYAGPLGAGRYLKEQIQATITGKNPNEDYAYYNNYLKNTQKTLVDQLRQTYQSSITPPNVREMIKPIVDSNGAIFGNNPELAEFRLNQFKDWLRNHTDYIFTAATKGVRAAYAESDKTKEKSTLSNQKNEKIRVINPKGQAGFIPKSQLKEALASGYTEG